MKRASLLLPATALVLTLLGAGWMRQQAGDDLYELKRNFEIFGALYEEIVVNYVNEVRPGPFMQAGVGAMLERLDPYTQFYDQADNVDLSRMRQRSIGDVGLNIGRREGRITVLAPETDTDAYARGIRPGDVILRVDEVEIEGWTVADVGQLLQGDAGTTVTLEVEREGAPDPLRFTLVRAVEDVDNVAYAGYLGDPGDRIGYVKLTMFGNRAAREVRRELRDLAREDGLNAVVLDLRHNPGGILSEAVEMVSLFVPKGTSVVSTQGRIENITQNYETGEDPYFADTPVFVLVDGISASASEIVSGALQDLDRAVIIGETTFGKGLVQIMRELPYNTSLKITVGHYYTPSGRDIQSRRIASSAAEVTAPDDRQFRTAGGRAVRSGVGVEPDVVVAGRESSELESALRRQGMFFRYAAHLAEENPGADIESLSLERDDLVPDFEGWLAEVGFEYRSNAEYLLDSLYVQFTDLEYARAASSLDGIRNVTLEEKRMDFQRYRDDLWSALRNEILARLAGEQERIRLSLDSDPVAQRALELARDSGAYRSLLGR